MMVTKWAELKHKASPAKRELLKKEALAELTSFEKNNSEASRSVVTLSRPAVRDCTESTRRKKQG